MQISTADLRKVVNILIDHLEENDCQSFELTADYYWHIPKELKYDPYQEPNNFSLGQLTDDWTELQGLLQGSSEPISYALVWLSSVIRFIGESATDCD